MIGRTSGIAEKSATVAVVVALLLGGLGFWGYTNLSTKFSFIDFIPTTSPLRVTFETLLADFGGGFGEEHAGAHRGRRRYSRSVEFDGGGQRWSDRDHQRGHVCRKPCRLLAGSCDWSDGSAGISVLCACSREKRSEQPALTNHSWFRPEQT